MHWWVFGTAWNNEEASRQLELMAQAHVGSVLIFPAHPYEVDNPTRGVHNQQYLSPEFFDTLNAVIARSRSLGLVLDIVAGTGCHGGPSVTVEDAARMLLRVRLPHTGSEEVQLPVLKAGEHLIGVFHVRPDGYHDVAAQVNDQRIRINDAVPGTAKFVLLLGSYRSAGEARLGRPEGPVLDHYNRAALLRYMDVVGAKLLANTPPRSFRSFFCDSLNSIAPTGPIFSRSCSNSVADITSWRIFPLSLTMPTIRRRSFATTSGARFRNSPRRSLPIL